MNKKFLVTGGSGFIGSNLIAKLVEDEEAEVLNIDISPPPDSKQAPYWKKLDILNIDVLKKAIDQFQPQYIIHLAARTDLNGQRLEDYTVNIEGTANLISACENISSVKKIIFVSTMLVCQVGYIPKSEIDYNANTVYGISKVNMEKNIRSRQLKWEWSIVRPTSIWGPGFKEPYRNFFEIVRNGRFLDLGASYCSKTYGYIGNTVYQIIEILKNPATNKKVYYLGDSPPIFISDWGKEIARLSGRKPPLKIPYFLAKLGAITGDLLIKLKIRFPLSTFRLKNMTTNNIIDLKELYDIAPQPPYTRRQGIIETIEWLNKKAEL